MSSIEEQIQEASARNAELLRTLAETDYAQPSLKEQIVLINDLQKQIEKNDKNLAFYDTQRKVELKDHEKYRDSHFRRFIYKATGNKDKFAEKASKEEKEYYDVLQKQHETTVLNNGLKEQHDEAKRVRGELETAVELHNHSQLELDSLYNSIFAGETSRFPEEDALERESDNSLQRYHDLRTKLEEEMRVIKLVNQAQGKVKTALQHMGDARSASRMDMFGFDGIADAMERSALTKADIAYRDARSFAERANFDDLPAVNINHGHIMRDIVFDNIFTDMQFHEEIKRAQNEMGKFSNFINQKLVMSQDRKKDVEVELKQAEKDLEAARTNLQAERMKLFEQVAKRAP
ncbi:unnamed protein product [Clonostachys solani]|uniref:Coiled-coil domain-containing protein n=1 Tax=Clonostachys solani TaxID=160281 RepID=A0A9N9Z018_9HYPO|nr:unnamed protein product [Clonostachys solani]